MEHDKGRKAAGSWAQGGGRADGDEPWEPPRRGVPGAVSSEAQELDHQRGGF